MRKSFRILLRATLVLAALLAVLSALAIWADRNDNFHAISPGTAYRSAQLEPEELRWYIKKYRIRAVLNLRGRNEESTWYQDEIRVCAEEDVTHYDLRLSAYAAPNERQLEELLTIFRNAERPLLIHCHGGADRSGLAAAIWRVYIAGDDKKQASAELSWRYGHLPFGRKKVLDEFFAAWDPPEPVAAAGD